MNCEKNIRILELLFCTKFIFAGQQCCYNSNGDIIRPPHPGAGTPDKKAGSLGNIIGHCTDDVAPYEKCCLQCEDPETYCPKYTNEVRGGDASHCPGLTIVNQNVVIDVVPFYCIMHA